MLITFGKVTETSYGKRKKNCAQVQEQTQKQPQELCATRKARVSVPSKTKSGKSGSKASEENKPQTKGTQAAYQLTSGQKQAAQAISQWFFNEGRQTFVLSGYAGTGKTFLLTHTVKNVLKLQTGAEAVFVAPTGKAAAVLVKNGTPAGTIHSLIYTIDENDYDVDENGEIIRPDRPKFVRRESIDEKIKLIVVDEASMVDETLLSDVLSFGVKCLFCGDRAQLPPVRGESVILSNVDYALTEIVRQAADNPILTVAHAAREGKCLQYGNYGGKVLVIPRGEFTGEKRKHCLLSADQVICGKNATRNALNEEMRAYLEHDGSLPEEGEKLVCTLNDWEKPLDSSNRFFLVNGVIGFSKNVRREGKGLASMDFFPDFLEGSVRVPFDAGIFRSGEYRYFFGDRAMEFTDGTFAHEGDYRALAKKKIVRDEPVCRFEFAYAITCHKSQGSEFNYVVVFDESRVFGEESNRWLYTAITRAKEKLIIVR